MKKSNILALCIAALFSSCASEFNKVYKTADNDYKYEYAKQCFAMGKFQQARLFASGCRDASER